MALFIHPRAGGVHEKENGCLWTRTGMNFSVVPKRKRMANDTETRSKTIPSMSFRRGRGDSRERKLVLEDTHRHELKFRFKKKTDG